MYKFWTIWLLSGLLFSLPVLVKYGNHTPMGVGGVIVTTFTGPVLGVFTLIYRFGNSPCLFNCGEKK